MDGRPADAVAFELAAHTVGPVLGAGEDQHPIELLLLEKAHKQVDLSGGSATGYTACEMASTGVALGATSTRAGLVRVGPATRMTSLDNVAEKSMFCRLEGKRAEDTAHIGPEAHVEHPVGFVKDEDLHMGKIDVTPLV